jgi:hypothetical protein
MDLPVDGHTWTARTSRMRIRDGIVAVVWEVIGVWMVMSAGWREKWRLSGFEL